MQVNCQSLSHKIFIDLIGYEGYYYNVLLILMNIISSIAGLSFDRLYKKLKGRKKIRREK